MKKYKIGNKSLYEVYLNDNDTPDNMLDDYITCVK